MTHQQEIKTKEEQITQLQLRIEQFIDYPKLEEFKKEALEANKALSQQLNLLCHKISLINPLCILTRSLINQAVNTILEFEDADDKVTNYLSWKSTVEGRVANLPKIQESHKEVLFLEWETQFIKEKGLLPGPEL